MKMKMIKLVLLAVCGSACAEQTNRLVRPPFDDRWWNGTLIPFLVQDIDVAGVGTFLNQPTTNNPYASVLVQDYWAGDAGTNVVKVNVGDPWETDWVFPTNVPVVFFASRHGSCTNGSDVVNLAEYYQQTKSQAWLDELFFPGGDAAWFRATRDNGLLYDFTTNLWNCVNTNPNPTNYYETLRDAEKVPFSSSSRLWIDAYKGFRFFLNKSSDEFLLDKFENDPLLSDSAKNDIDNMILNRRLKQGWTFTNGVLYPPQ
jgi:hypothetical protein